MAAQALDRAADLLREVSVSLRPERMHGRQALALFERATEIQRLAAAITTRLAGRLEEANAHVGSAKKDAAGVVAERAGVSYGTAKGMVETGKRLARNPELDAAVANGELSETQTRLVADAAAANPDATESLLDTARRRSHKDLVEACQDAKAAADPDPDDTRNRAHRARHLRSWKGEGGTHFKGFAPDDAWAVIAAALGPIQERIFRANRDRGVHDTREASALDALVELARGSGGSRGEGPKGSAVVIVDESVLRTGTVAEGDRCEIAGIGAVPRSTALSILADCHLEVVICDGIDIRHHVNLKRTVTKAQRSALFVMYPRCAIEGCDVDFGLEIDHVEEWRLTHRTVLSDLVRLCRFHHDQKTYRKWRLERQPQGWRILPPEAPHPPAQHHRDHPRPDDPVTLEDLLSV
jgi:hypothetical protein